MNYLLKMLLSTILIMVAAYLVPGIDIDTFLSAFVFAIVLSLINIFMKPILVILTFPFTVITFGLFLLAIDSLLIMLAGNFVDGIEVLGFWPAFLFGILLSILQTIFNVTDSKMNN